MSEHKLDAILTPEEKATLADLVSVCPGIKDFVAGVIDRLSEGRLDEMLAYKCWLTWRRRKKMFQNCWAAKNPASDQPPKS